MPLTHRTLTLTSISSDRVLRSGPWPTGYNAKHIGAPTSDPHPHPHPYRSMESYRSTQRGSITDKATEHAAFEAAFTGATAGSCGTPDLQLYAGVSVPPLRSQLRLSRSFYWLQGLDGGRLRLPGDRVLCIPRARPSQKSMT